MKIQVLSSHSNTFQSEKYFSLKMEFGFLAFVIAFSLLAIFILVAILVFSGNGNSVSQNPLKLSFSEYFRTIYTFSGNTILAVSSSSGIQQLASKDYISLTSPQQTFANQIMTNLSQSSSGSYIFLGAKEVENITIYYFSAISSGDYAIFFVNNTQAEITLYTNNVPKNKTSLNIIYPVYDQRGNTFTYQYTSSSYIIVTISEFDNVSFWYSDGNTNYLIYGQYYDINDPNLNQSYGIIVATKENFVNRTQISAEIEIIEMTFSNVLGLTNPFSLSVNKSQLQQIANKTTSNSTQNISATIQKGYDFFIRAATGPNTLVVNGVTIDDSSFEPISYLELIPFFANKLVETGFIYSSKTIVLIYNSGDTAVLRYLNDGINQYVISVTPTPSAGTYSVNFTSGFEIISGSNYLSYTVQGFSETINVISSSGGSSTYTMELEISSPNLVITLSDSSSVVETINVPLNEILNLGYRYQTPSFNSTVLGNNSQLWLDVWGNPTVLAGNTSLVTIPT